jgi:hypothetical protein
MSVIFVKEGAEIRAAVTWFPSNPRIVRQLPRKPELRRPSCSEFMREAHWPRAARAG